MEEGSINEEQDQIVPEWDPEVEESAQQVLVHASAGSGERDTIDDGNDFRSLEERVGDLSLKDSSSTDQHASSDNDQQDFESEQREQHGEKTEETKQMLEVEESVQLAPESAGRGENDTIDDGNDQTLVVSPQETVHIVELLASEAIAPDMAVEEAAEDEIGLNLPPEELVELEEFLEHEEEIARQLETERAANSGISSSPKPPNKNHDFTVLGNFRVGRRVEFPFQQARSEDAVATSSMQSSIPWDQECLPSTPCTEREGGNANQGKDLTDEENDHEFIMAVCNMAKIQRMFPNLFKDNLAEDQIHVVVDSKGNFRELYQSNIDEIAERFPELSQQIMVLEDIDAEEEFDENEACTEPHETFEIENDVLPTQMTFNNSVEIVNIPSEEESAAEDILSVERENEHGEETDDKTYQLGDDAKSDIVKCGCNPPSVSTQVTQENDNAKGNDVEYENTSESDDEDFQHFLTWRDNYTPVLKEIKMLFSKKKYTGPLENDNAKGNDEEYENTAESDDEDFQHFLTWRDNYTPVLKEIKMLFSKKKHTGPLENDNAKGNDEEYENTAESDDEDFQHFLTWRDNYTPVLKEIKMLFSKKKHTGPLENDNAKGNDGEYENTSESDDEDFQHFLTWRDNYTPVLKEIKMLFSKKKHTGFPEFQDEDNGSYSQNTTRNNSPQEPDEMPATSNTLFVEEDVVQERSGATPNPLPMDELLTPIAARRPREGISVWEEALNLLREATMDDLIEQQQPLEGNIEPQAQAAAPPVEAVEIELPLGMPSEDLAEFVLNLFRENVLGNHARREGHGGENCEAVNENKDG